MRFLTIDCFLMWIIFHMTIWQCCCNQIFDFRVSNLNKCWQRDDYVLRMFGVSLQRCVEECGKRQICEGINYRRQIKLCELISTTFTADLVVNTIADGPCISVHRNDIHTQTNCNCSAHEVCDPTGVCNVQECSTFSITNGNFLGNLNNIGVRVKFTCDSGFTEVNDKSTATCLVNGDWSVIPQCNTVIGDGGNLPGDTHQYSCVINEYGTLSNDVDVVTTCLRKGTWSDTNFTCDWNIDECDSGTDTCAVNAVCENTQGSFTCTCNSGYTGDGESCTDVNECDAGTNTCYDNAVCENTQGSYTCTCNSGYTGAVESCTDLNECDSGTNTCTVNAECDNTQGSYTCTCNSGYTGDGESCTDVKECYFGTDTCAVNAVCENTQGSYTCTCNSGYTGDGESCTDVNECDSTTNTCDVNDECENTQGSYTCTCKSGYTGDGGSCTDVNECDDGTDTCDVNAECDNTQGSYTCTCNSGYTGDGESCTDYADCDSPPEYPRSAIYYNRGITVGTTRPNHYHCHYNYSTDNDNIITATTCLVDVNSTEPNVTCFRVCGLPAVDGVNSTGMTRVYTCSDHYQNLNDEPGTVNACSENGTWSAGNVTCDWDCGSTLHYPNYSILINFTLAGTTRQYHCDDTNSSGNGRVVMETTCISGGNWTAANFTCFPVCGTPHEITNSVIDGGGNLPGDTRQYRCAEGYSTPSYDVDMVTTCLPNGTWSYMDFTCDWDCGNVTIANGVATVDNGTTVLNNATITCNCGYKLHGENTLTCTTTGWDKAFPICNAWTPQCPEGFQLYCNSCYLFDTASYTWDEAWVMCQDEYNGHLVHIDNQAEDEWLASTCRTIRNSYGNKVVHFWINLSDRSVEGKWKWNDTNTEAIYTNWAPNEPNHINNGGENEDCASNYLGSSYEWADLNCGLNTISAICERAPIADSGADLLNNA